MKLKQITDRIDELRELQLSVVQPWLTRETLLQEVAKVRGSEPVRICDGTGTLVGIFVPLPATLQTA